MLALRPVFVFVLLSWSLCAGAQFSPALRSYHAFMNKAALANAAGHADSALQYYRQALSACSLYNPPYYDIGNMLLQKGRYAEGIAFLKKEIGRGSYSGTFEDLFKNYDTLKAVPEIVAFRSEYPTLLKSRVSMAGIEELSRLVYRMLGADQAMRRISNAAALGIDSLTDHDIRFLQCYLDTAVNRPLLLDYLSRYSFPAADSMDADLSQSLNIIVLHLLDYQDRPGQQLDSIVQQAVYTGRFSPFQYLMTLDRRHMARTGKQLYGTYMMQTAQGWSFAPEIDSIAEVDIRRARWEQLPLRQLGIIDWRNPPMPVGYRP